MSFSDTVQIENLVEDGSFTKELLKPGIGNKPD